MTEAGEPTSENAAAAKVDAPAAVTPAEPTVAPPQPPSTQATAPPLPLGSGPGGVTAADIFPAKPVALIVPAEMPTAALPHVPAELARASPTDGGEPHAPPGPGAVAIPASQSMAKSAEKPQAAPARQPLMGRELLRLALMAALALLLIGAALYDYRTNTRDNYQRNRCLLAIIFAAGGATLCLAGAMRTIDAIITARPPWYWRAAGLTLVRLLMIAELATTAAALACGGLLYFHQDIPAPTTGLYYAPPTPPGVEGGPQMRAPGGAQGPGQGAARGGN